MNVWVLATILASIGGAVGVALGHIGRKRNQASKVAAYIFLIAAAFQVFITITGTRHPYVNVAVAALLAGAGIAMLVRNLPRSHNAKTG